MGVPAAELRTEASRVIHSGGRSMSYADIAKVAQAPAELPKVDKSMLKPMAQFRLIGKDIPRVDVPAKSSGKALYGIDQRLPGMLWASVLRAPVQGEVPESVDDSAARAVASGFVLLGAAPARGEQQAVDGRCAAGLVVVEPWREVEDRVGGRPVDLPRFPIRMVMR